MFKHIYFVRDSNEVRLIADGLWAKLGDKATRFRVSRTEAHIQVGDVLDIRILVATQTSTIRGHRYHSFTMTYCDYEFQQYAWCGMNILYSTNNRWVDKELDRIRDWIEVRVKRWQSRIGRILTLLRWTLKTKKHGN